MLSCLHLQYCLSFKCQCHFKYPCITQMTHLFRVFVLTVRLNWAGDPASRRSTSLSACACPKWSVCAWSQDTCGEFSNTFDLQLALWHSGNSAIVRWYPIYVSAVCVEQRSHQWPWSPDHCHQSPRRTRMHASLSATCWGSFWTPSACLVRTVKQEAHWTHI